MEIINKKCVYCGKEFTIKRKDRKNQKYCSRKCLDRSHGINLPTKKELLKTFKKLITFSQVGKFYNVTSNSIRKWCKKYDLPYHSNKMVEYINNMG